MAGGGRAYVLVDPADVEDHLERPQHAAGEVVQALCPANLYLEGVYALSEHNGCLSLGLGDMEGRLTHRVGRPHLKTGLITLRCAHPPLWELVQPHSVIARLDIDLLVWESLCGCKLRLANTCGDSIRTYLKKARSNTVVSGRQCVSYLYLRDPAIMSASQIVGHPPPLLKRDSNVKHTLRLGASSL
jgi:hypothetical protein